MSTRKTSGDVNVMALKSMVEVAAFAAEAQRTLEAIRWTGKALPEVDKAIRQAVSASGNWAVMELPIGDLLSHVASELQKLADYHEEAGIA